MSDVTASGLNGEDGVVARSDTPISRVSWGAILAGVVCGVAIYLVLGIIGLSVGFAVVDPAHDQSPLEGVATGAGIWWLLSSFAAFFCGGLVAGRMSGIPRSLSGALHGLTVWALGTIALVMFATSTIGSAVTGVAGAMGGLIGGGNQRAIQVDINRPSQNTAPSGNSQQSGSTQEASTGGQQGSLPGVITSAQRALWGVTEDIRTEARTFVDQVLSDREQRRAGQAIQATYADLIRTPGDADQDLRNLYQTLLSNDGVIGADDRQRAKQLLMQRLGVPEADADQVLDNWSQQYQTAVRNLNDVVARLRQELQGRVQQTADRAADATQSAAQGVGDGVRSVVSRQEQRQATRIVSNTASDIARNPAMAVGEIQGMLDQLFAANGVFGKEDATEAARLLERTTGIEEAEAEQIIARWQARYQAAAQEVNRAAQQIQTAAVQAAQETTDVLAETSAWAAVALILAGFAASLGGLLGRPEDWLFMREQVRQIRPPRLRT